MPQFKPRCLALWKGVVFACVFMVHGLPAFAYNYVIRALGPAPVPPTFSSAGKAINNRGEILADGVFGPYNGTPSIYLPFPDYGLAAGLDYLPFSGFTNFTGLSSGWFIDPIIGYLPFPFLPAFNDQGQILGTLTKPPHAGLWQNGKVKDLGTLGGSNSIPIALNQRGDVVGYSAASDNGPRQPFIFLAGTATMQTIPALANRYGLVGFNNQRQILGYSTLTGEYVLWQDGIVKRLYDLLGIDQGPPPVPNPNDPGSYFLVDGTYHSVYGTVLNDLGEIYGSVMTSVVNNSVPGGPSMIWHTFIYSPVGGNGLKPGINYDALRDDSLTPGIPLDMIINWNTNGQILYFTDYSNTGGVPSYYFWDQGRSVPLQALVPGSVWTNLTPYGLNDRGDIVGIAYSNNVGQAFVLALPDISATITASPIIAHLGDAITVTQIAVNNNRMAPGTVTNVQFYQPLLYIGTGGVKPVPLTNPPAPASLAPGASVSLIQYFIATNGGSVRFESTALGNGPRGQVTYAGAISAPVNIVPKGDLLIKRATEPDSLYAGSNVFQTVPIPPQLKTNIVSSTNDISTFQVQIWNNDPKQQTFTLQAQEDGNPVWKRTFLLSGGDVTAPLIAPGGMTLPAMAPGTALTLNVTVQDTNALPGDNLRVRLILGLASDPTLTLDAVEAQTLLIPVIVVNSTGDLPLLDPNGCCCDTGGKLAGTNVAECTLRAAIQLANRNAGKDIIKFQIPPGDPGIVDGVPSIQPQTALPDIIDPVVIDGWSQSPTASSPPVELSGRVASPRAERGMLGGGSSGQDLVQNLLLADYPSGLHLMANGCEIRGLVVNSFPMCGILVDGSDAVIQGNYLGTDPSGSIAASSGLSMVWVRNYSGYTPDYRVGGGGAQLCLRSPGNLVGGTDPKLGNVISGGPVQINPDGSTDNGWVGSPGLVMLGEAANGNVVEGNIIGLDASASYPPPIPPNGRPRGDIHGTGQYVGGLD